MNEAVLPVSGSEQTKIKILIADDHLFFRRGLYQAFERFNDLEVVGEASTGMEVVDLARRLRPDVILMDVQLPGFDGVQAAGLIFEENPAAHIIMLTAYARDEYVFEAIKAGAQGFLLKGVDEQRLVDAVRAVERGNVLVDAQVAPDVLKEFRRLSNFEKSAQPAAHLGKIIQPEVQVSTSAQGVKIYSERIEQLTGGEVEVLRLVARGEDNAAIARLLSLSEKTVSNRLSMIYDKLEVSGRVQAALVALRCGLVDL